jgi:amino acid adenylation domain-containing protein
MRAFHQCFEAQASARPESIAVTAGAADFSYREIDERANRLARALRQIGVDVNAPVGLCLPPGVDAVIAMLAVLKAGGGYVALEPKAPQRRLALMLQQSEPAAVLTSTTLVDRLGEHGLPSLCIDRDQALIAAQSATRLDLPVSAGQLCYVMFTSGSTGSPKGVEVTHGNVAELFNGFQTVLPLGPGEVWTWFHSMAFGFSVWEIWGALRHGGRLVVVPGDSRLDPAAFRQLLDTQRVTVCSQTPTAFRQNFLTGTGEPDWLDGMKLRALVLSGESVVETDLQRWFDQCGGRGPRLFNTYAITETSGQLTVQEYRGDQLEPGMGRVVGRPLPGARLLVLDAAGKPVPEGAEGELYVGGAGVARGYLKDPDLTSRKFLHLATNGRKTERVYRTGDRARLRSDGSLEFIGRRDQQVKIRGYRVELSEIEETLRAHPGVREAAATVYAGTSGSMQLAAYFVPEGAVPQIAGAAPAPQLEPEFWPSIGPYQIYDEFLYDLMSAENLRLDSYRHALGNVARDKVVLDLGTGEHAVLARMCIEAGARRVYAVEVLPEACRRARELVARLGLGERIRVIEGDIASVELPEQVDVCTQGIIGNIGSADGIASIWNSAQRFFKPSCVPVPASCRTMIAPVELPADLRARPGLRGTASRYAEKLFEQAGRRFDVRLCVRNMPPSSLLASPLLFEELDFHAELAAEGTGSGVFQLKRAGRFDGFLAWTRVTAAAGAQVDYLDTQQAWLPVFLPLPDGSIPVAAGDHLEAQWESRVRSGICPDYRVRGVLRTGHGRRELGCESRHQAHAYNQTTLHRAIWAAADEIAGPADAAGLRAWLAARLPEYMIPTSWVTLDRLPVTANGKLDRHALPPPRRQTPREGTRWAAPDTPLEKELAGLWTEVLEIPQVGLNDNFFDLGGDSISAVRLTSGLQRLLDVGVSLVAIFDAPTIAELTAYLAKHHAGAVDRRMAAAERGAAGHAGLDVRDLTTSAL